MASDAAAAANGVVDAAMRNKDRIVNNVMVVVGTQSMDVRIILTSRYFDLVVYIPISFWVRRFVYVSTYYYTSEFFFVLGFFGPRRQPAHDSTTVGTDCAVLESLGAKNALPLSLYYT
jgi:hypothetical protein